MNFYEFILQTLNFLAVNPGFTIPVSVIIVMFFIVFIMKLINKKSFGKNLQLIFSIFKRNKKDGKKRNRKSKKEYESIYEKYKSLIKVVEKFNTPIEVVLSLIKINSNRKPLMENDLFTFGHKQFSDVIETFKKEIGNAGKQWVILNYLEIVLDTIITSLKKYFTVNNDLIEDDSVEMDFAVFIELLYDIKNNIKKAADKKKIPSLFLERVSYILDPHFNTLIERCKVIKTSPFCYNDYIRFYTILILVSVFLQNIFSGNVFSTLVIMNGELVEIYKDIEKKL